MSTKAFPTTPLAPLQFAGTRSAKKDVVLAQLSYTTDALNIPLAALQGSVGTEQWCTAQPLSRGEFEGGSYTVGEQLCFVSLHMPEHAQGMAAAAELAYQRVIALGRSLGLPHMLRIWHYLYAINDGVGDNERYKQFCLGRARAMRASNIGDRQLPAATLVGSQAPGLRMHCLLVRAAPIGLENPRQVSAYRYPREYGPRQPAFARAVIMPWADSQPQLFISGTASIVGHNSMHTQNIARQLDESMRNVRVLLDAAAEHMGTLTWDDLDLLKVYLRKPQDAALAQQQLTNLLGISVPMVFLHANLCRRELLVEVETQVTRLR